MNIAQYTLYNILLYNEHCTLYNILLYNEHCTIYFYTMNMPLLCSKGLPNKHQSENRGTYYPFLFFVFCLTLAVQLIR